MPTPESYLGHPVGADRRLANWDQIIGYLEQLAQMSPRVIVDTLGRTTLNRRFVMATISSTENLEQLDRYRAIQQQLADPRQLPSAAAADWLIAEGKVVVLITAAIHPTEVGASQVPLQIAYRLASSSGALEREILDNVILLLVPSLNPDGVDLVADWYERTLGQPWEGTNPPFLYHHYTGHDNNRDWYAFTQQETRLTVEHAHNAWRPQIVLDIHQMGNRGARAFVPPYIDPFEPNVDPVLIAGVNELGSYIAWELGQQGKRGVVTNAIYDAWTPARAYQHYHGGVRILSETASANMASPVQVSFDSLRPGRNYDPRTQSVNFPDPWPGGDWTLGDIVAYQEASAFALLTHAARHREAWLRSFLQVGQRAVAKWPEWPAAWVIPAQQTNAEGLRELLRILVTADVEVRTAITPFAGVGRTFPPGTYVIDMRQPYAAFAQTVLERQDYPDLRLYPGGPPRQPYDVTAHTLPLLLGVEAFPAARIETMSQGLLLSAPIPAPELTLQEPGLSAGIGPAPPRIGVYQSSDPSMDEGWTRWVLDRYRIPFRSVRDQDMRAGGLHRSFDVLLFPSQSALSILNGRAPGTVPPEYAGGLGEMGVAALREFVRGGGTVVALEEASEFVIDVLDLPLRNVLEGLPTAEFFIPGSISSLRLDTAHPLAGSLPNDTIAWFGEKSMAFQTTGPGVVIVGWYGCDPLLSGWALGPEYVAGVGALAEARVDAGRVVLFGFKPQYRGQSMATFPLLFNALRFCR